MDLDPTPPPHENRVKAKRPLFDLSANRLRAYPVKYRRYFNDHFGWRNWLIRTNAVLSTQVLGISPIPRRVTIGKEGWFFLNGHSGVHFRGVDPFTTEELEEWRVLLESRRDWLAVRGIDFMFVLAPDKNSVYPEKLPAGVKRGIQRVDQLLEYLSEASCLRVIDLRPVLREAKTQGDVYERTGTHWNAAGTWAAYREIMKELASLRPEMRALAEREVKWREFVPKGLGLARMAALENVVLENDSIVWLFRVFSGWPTGSRLLHPADPTSPAVTSEPKRRPRNPQIPYTPVRSWATRKGNKTLINRELSL